MKFNGTDSSAARFRVLIADDSTSVRASLGKLLTAQGYDVRMACNGDDLFHILSRDKIDLVLLDLDMPEPDGWRTLERLSDDCPELPVIVVTGQPGERDWAARHGARALLEKPPDIPALLKAVEDLTELPRPKINPRQRRATLKFRYSPPRLFDFRVTPSNPLNSRG